MTLNTRSQLTRFLNTNSVQILESQGGGSGAGLCPRRRRRRGIDFITGTPEFSK